MVTIRVINETDSNSTSELQAAKDLRDLLMSSLSDEIKGEIIIAHNLTLVGQNPRDVDILIAGKLDNYVLRNYYTNNIQYKKKDLHVDSFCIAIELKQQIEQGVRINGTQIEVLYKNYWKDASSQNEGQRYSVVNYFHNEFGYDPWVTNFVWLKSLSSKQLLLLRRGNPIGALHSNISFKDIVDMMIIQDARIDYDNLGDKSHHIRVADDRNQFLQDFKDIFASQKRAPQGLTRKKLDLLVQKRVNSSLNNTSIGNQLTIFTGKAGTGKTFNLIQAALQLANPDSGVRCIILTYNHALVSDIRRLLHFMDIPDGIDNYTIQIQTLHSFFIRIMKSLDINTDNICGSRFEREYNKRLEELKETIVSLMDDKDIKILKEDNQLAIDWDYIFVDEGQDWSDIEKEILFHIYGSNRIIVADGVDQFIRCNKKQMWQRRVDKVLVEKQKKGLRQKANLSEFVNAVAREMGLDWEIKPNNVDGWSGGQVLIYDSYRAKLHKELEKYNSMAGCDNYDMLFLVPPSMVEEIDENTKQFQKTKDWEDRGIRIFDGTNQSLRQSYPTDVNQCRLFQYDSCRGLEGWITVCLHFDELVEYKTNEAKSMMIEPVELESKEDTIKKYVYLWCLMPLTRPIDTLIITLKDENSEIGKILKRVATNHSDFVHWLISKSK